METITLQFTIPRDYLEPAQQIMQAMLETLAQAAQAPADQMGMQDMSQGMSPENAAMQKEIDELSQLRQ